MHDLTTFRAIYPFFMPVFCFNMLLESFNSPIMKFLKKFEVQVRSLLTIDTEDFEKLVQQVLHYVMAGPENASLLNSILNVLLALHACVNYLLF